MNKKELFDLYQKLYFHELEIKEKLIVRLQLTFAFLTTVIAITAYMLRMLDTNSDLLLLVWFYYFMALAIIALIPAIFYAIKAFWGNDYLGLPTAKETEDYRKKVEAHEKSHKVTYVMRSKEDNKKKPPYSAENELQEYLYDLYAKCSSHNTNLKDLRSFQLREVTKWLLISALPLLAACFIFIGFDLDASSPRKNLLIENKSLEHTIEKMIEAVHEKDSSKSN